MRKNLQTLLLVSLLVTLSCQPVEAGPLKRRFLGVCKLFAEIGAIAGTTVIVASDLLYEQFDALQEADRAKEYAKKYGKMQSEGFTAIPLGNPVPVQPEPVQEPAAEPQEDQKPEEC